MPSLQSVHPRQLRDEGKLGGRQAPQGKGAEGRDEEDAHQGSGLVQEAKEAYAVY